jgi:acetyl-CoA carboxylase biotin carboxyl carrier protein
MPNTPRRPAEISPKLVRELADILKDTDLSEIEVERGDLKIRVARGSSAPQTVYAHAPAPMAHAPAPVQAAAPAPAAAPETPAQPTGAASKDAVTSPMVGTVYLRANPESDVFVKPGQAVKEGDTILLVEAMKTFNPITAPKSGTLQEVLVGDGQPVEYGEPLFVIA